MTDINRQINHSRANEIGNATRRAAVLTAAEQVRISGEATAQAYRDALAKHQPIPDSQQVQRARHDALNKAIDAKLAGAA